MDSTNIELELIVFFVRILDEWIYLEQQYILYWGVVGALGLIAFLMLGESKLRWLGAAIFLVAFVIQPLLFLVCPYLSLFLKGSSYELPGLSVVFFFFELAMIVSVWVTMMRLTSPIVDRLKNLLTKRSSLVKTERTDIRNVGKLLPSIKKAIKIEKYIKDTRKIFFGLNPQRKQVSLAQGKWRSSHLQVVGTTGAGKGVLAGCLLHQSVNQGESVFAFDPKGDEFLPHVLGQAAMRAGVPFIYIDLPGDIPQYKPEKNKSFYELEELFSSGFGMNDQGNSADFYRINDRKAARALAKLCSANSMSLDVGLKQLLQVDPGFTKSAPKFIEDIEELISLPVANVCASGGLDIEAAINEGAVVYIRGSMRNPRVLKLQKMMLLSIMQHCEKRDRSSARQVCIFLDEFKYMISKPAMEALGAIRDKRAHVILAHQSLGDLRDCPKDLDSESVISSVVENCSLKIAYKINDPDTAEWLSRMSGKILIDDETKMVESNSVLVESKKNGRVLRQAERSLIDTNMLMSLPPRCAVLFGNGLADFVFTSPIEVVKRDEYVTATKFSTSYQVAAKAQKTTSKSFAEDLLDVD